MCATKPFTVTMHDKARARDSVGNGVEAEAGVQRDTDRVGHVLVSRMFLVTPRTCRFGALSPRASARADRKVDTIAVPKQEAGLPPRRDPSLTGRLPRWEGGPSQ